MFGYANTTKIQGNIFNASLMYLKDKVYIAISLSKI